MSKTMIGLLAMLALQRCAGIPPGNPGFNSCDAVAAGDFSDRLARSELTQKDVERGVRAVLDAATFTTDPRLHDQTENCKKLVGYRVYTMPKLDFVYPYDNKTMVSGYTVCLTKLIVIGTPANGDFRKSSLVHEFFHALQECNANPNAHDDDPRNWHFNWDEDGIFRAIEAQENKP